MTRIRHDINRKLANQPRRAVLDGVPHVDAFAAGRSCIANDHCTRELVPDCPVPLCGVHLAEVFHFAADLITERAGFIWPEPIPQGTS